MVFPWHAAHSPVVLDGLAALFVVLFLLLVEEGVPGISLGKILVTLPRLQGAW